MSSSSPAPRTWSPSSTLTAPASKRSATGYRVTRYRPRIEGLFARIERWTNVDDPADTFWRSISRDNVTTLYGKTSESRIADPTDPTRIFTWLICESFDDKGNAALYEYVAEDGRMSTGSGKRVQPHRQRAARPTAI